MTLEQSSSWWCIGTNVVMDVGVGGTLQDSHSIESQHCTHYRRGVTNIIQLEAESNWTKWDVFGFLTQSVSLLL